MLGQGVVGRCVFTYELCKQKTLENEILYNYRGNYGGMAEREFHQVLLSICKVFLGILDKVDEKKSVESYSRTFSP